MSWDVVVVGAGTAGAAAAVHCARQGMRVLCVDAGTLDGAGARWVNGVPRWAFPAAGFEPPQAPECLGGPVPFHLVAGWGPERITVRDHDLLEVDMRLLVQRLQGLARDAGAELRQGVRVNGLQDGVLQTSEGPLKAEVVVDASGLRGVGLLGRRPPTSEDICVAAQQVHVVTDHEAAVAWFAKNGAQLGETLAFTGVAGGYSVLNVRYDGEHLGILTGSIPALGHTAAPLLLQRFTQENPWVGQKHFGGSRALPLGAPAACIGRDGVALIGDAAVQVHGAHGSGIAQQLLAAKVLGEQLAAGAGVEGYDREWRRRHGGLLQSADVFRRFSQTLSIDDITRLMRSGAMGPGMTRETLVQRDPQKVWRDTPRATLGLLRNPRLGARMVPVLLKMGLASLRAR